MLAASCVLICAASLLLAQSLLQHEFSTFWINTLNLSVGALLLLQAIRRLKAT